MSNKSNEIAGEHGHFMDGATVATPSRFHAVRRRHGVFSGVLMEEAVKCPEENHS
jgi:hypothetical protein